MSRYLSLVLCLVCAPCFGATVTYDFTEMEEIPEWMNLTDGGLYENVGLSNYDLDYSGELRFDFSFDMPFQLDSMTLVGGLEIVWSQAILDCNSQPGTIDQPPGFPGVEYDFDCFSHNGRGGFSLYAGADDFTGQPHFVGISSMTLTHFEPVPFVSGDTDYDADVDVQDLNNTRNAFGGNPVFSFGDTDRDGAIGVTDLNSVRNNFGASVLSNPVPEPSCFALLAIAATGFRIWKTRQFRSLTN